MERGVSLENPKPDRSNPKPEIRINSNRDRPIQSSGIFFGFRVFGLRISFYAASPLSLTRVSIATLSNIEKTFGKRVIFDKLSLNVERGERIGFIGSNGSGKTTLFKVLIGQIVVDVGSVSIAKGTKVAGISRRIRSLTRPILSSTKPSWRLRNFMNCRIAFARSNMKWRG